MKIVLQRVNKASVTVDGEIKGSIGKGYLLLLGISPDDTLEKCEKAIQKIKNLRIFSDENGKINLSIKDVDGSVLVVSQFTLYADCKKGNRPSFTEAAKPDFAEKTYNEFVNICRKNFPDTQCGVFGADMKVSLENDGPFTLVLEY